MRDSPSMQSEKPITASLFQPEVETINGRPFLNLKCCQQSALTKNLVTQSDESTITEKTQKK